jgi:hypothetical protein
VSERFLPTASVHRCLKNLPDRERVDRLRFSVRAGSLGEILSGHPKLAASSVPDMLSPAAGIVCDLAIGKGVKKAGQDLYANLPLVTAIEQAGGHDSKTYPYEGTPLQAFLRYLVGTGFVPRETDTQTLERSYENEREVTTQPAGR